jgi:hypothetical protein
VLFYFFFTIHPQQENFFFFFLRFRSWPSNQDLAGGRQVQAEKKRERVLSFFGAKPRDSAHPPVFFNFFDRIPPESSVVFDNKCYKGSSELLELNPNEKDAITSELVSSLPVCLTPLF